MTWRTVTGAFLVGLTAVIAVYDVVAAVFGGYQATISSVLYFQGQKWPIIPFALGVLAGHLFFPNREASK